MRNLINTERDIIVVRDMMFKDKNETDAKGKRPGLVIHYDKENMITYFLALRSLKSDKHHHKLKNYSLKKKEAINLDKNSLIDLRFVNKVKAPPKVPVAIVDDYIYQEVLSNLIENQQTLAQEFNIIDEDYQLIEELLLQKVDPEVLQKVRIRKSRERSKRIRAGIYEQIIKETYLDD